MEQTVSQTRDTEGYWNSAARTYEQDFSGTILGQIRREIVWAELERLFLPGERVLELNCGTGIDAVFLSRRGVKVVGCDLSPKMIDLAKQQADAELLPVSPEFPEFIILANEDLSALGTRPTFDGAFSNFSGLNCVDGLPAVSVALGALLHPGAPLLLCMMGRFVPFEILWFLAHRKWKQAFVRVKEDRTEYGPPTGLIIRRPTVAQIERDFQAQFRLLRWKGMGIVVPPSYAEHLAVRLPRVTAMLAQLDRRLGGLRFFRNMADCVLLEFVRSSQSPAG